METASRSLSWLGEFDTARWTQTAIAVFLAVVVGVIAGINPALAIAAALSFGFVLLLLADLAVGIVAFTVLSFIALVPSGVGPVGSFLKVGGLLLLLSWLATVARSDRPVPNLFAAHPALSSSLVFFCSWAALSAVWAEDPAASIVDFTRYALNGVLLVIVFSAVRERRHAVWVIAAFVAGTTVSAAYGLIVPPSADTLEADRLSGTLGNANELAAILVAGAALSVGLMACLKKSPALRLLTAGAGIFCAASVVLTQSRTGLVAGAVALIAAVLLGRRHRGRIGFLVLVVALLGFGYFTAVAPVEVRERISDPGNGTGRTDLWTVGRRMVEAEPVTGVGAGNFKVASIHFLLEPGALERDDFIVDTPKVAHNMYLEVLAEMGPVGLLAFLFILVACARLAGRAIGNFARAGDAEMEGLTRALLVALIAILVADFFNSGQFQKSLWLLLGLCPALYAISLRAGESDSSAVDSVAPGS
jgi:O-antigen ligase